MCCQYIGRLEGSEAAGRYLSTRVRRVVITFTFTRDTAGRKVQPLRNRFVFLTPSFPQRLSNSFFSSSERGSLRDNGGVRGEVNLELPGSALITADSKTNMATPVYRKACNELASCYTKTGTGCYVNRLATLRYQTGHITLTDWLLYVNTLTTLCQQTGYNSSEDWQN